MTRGTGKDGERTCLLVRISPWMEDGHLLLVWILEACCLGVLTLLLPQAPSDTPQSSRLLPSVHWAADMGFVNEELWLAMALRKPVRLGPEDAVCPCPSVQGY